jgi:uncharacterized protein involved in exopolysaccharide biosynthesis
MRMNSIALAVVMLYTSAQAQTNDHLNEQRYCNSIIADALTTNSTITRLRQQYLELVNREAEFSVRYGKDHAAVVVLRKQISDIKSSVLNEFRRLAENMNCPIEIDKYCFPDCLESR